jgi:NTP pyrophosphatase (non-canonical NTP hydrolase)
MQDVELTDESNEGGYDQAEYYDALFDEYPALNSAIDWAAAGGMDPEFVQHFNDATASGDLDQVHEFIELLLKDYEEFGEEVEPEEDETTTDELTPDEEGELEEFVSELLSNEPEGEEVAEGWQDQVATAQESGDEAWALVCAANAAYHAGEVDAQDAITYVLNELSVQDLRRIGSHLSGY